MIEKMHTIRQLSSEKIKICNSLNNDMSLARVILQGSVEFLKEILEKGANINSLPSYSKSTALHDAIDFSAYKSVSIGIQMITALLEKKADIHRSNSLGQSPLQCAAYYGNAKVINLLIDKIEDVNKIDASNYTPLHWMVRMISKNDRIESVRRLLDKKAEVNIPEASGQTPLHCAAEYGLVDVVKVLLENKADINQADTNGNTPLLLATKHKKTEIIEAMTLWSALEKKKESTVVSELWKRKLEHVNQVTQYEWVKFDEKRPNLYRVEKTYSVDKIMELIKIQTSLNGLVKKELHETAEVFISPIGNNFTLTISIDLNQIILPQKNLLPLPI